MNNNEYKTIGLYDHNADSYDQIKSSFKSGQDVVGIVHATGTGKSYNALQLAYDNKDKKIVYIVPSQSIIEHIKKIIDDNPKLDLKKDFPNLEFRTYQSFISLSKNEIKDINCDLLILDEFHHIGAPVWGARINTLIETHPDMKIFGMTAYTVRDRNTAYERDMANPNTNELFSNKIISRYDLCDAMIDGVLPKPIYKSAYINLIELESKLESKLEDRVKKLEDRKKIEDISKEYAKYMEILNDVKKRIQEAPSIPNILKKSIKPDGKYIYFCPPCSEEGTNDIETIKKQALEWFKQFIPEEDIVFYTSTSEMGNEGKKNREAFYNDTNLDGGKVDSKLRVMFAINQYNEGIHAPNIDGVIMGRGTTSDIVYFEQLGRALSVRGNTKDKFDELEQYSKDYLISLCKEKDIPTKENNSKEELIEKLIAPTVIDLTNNYNFIKELENNLKNRIKNIKKKGLGNHRNIKIRDASFNIEIENQDLFEMLRYVMDRLTMTWEDYYELAKAYREKHGDLLIRQDFKTIDGIEYDENGVNLGSWINTQRRSYKEQDTCKLSNEQIKMLDEIDMVWDVYNYKWYENYKLAEAYHEKHGDLLIPSNYKTINGVNLGSWIRNQRDAYKGKGTCKLSNEQIKKLEEIDMVWDALTHKWDEYYELAKAYLREHGDLSMPNKFKTKDGVNLRGWIDAQRVAYKGQNSHKISDEQIKKLEEINFMWFTDGTDQKLQQEKIDSKNLKKKKIEIENRFYTLLNKYSNNSMPSNEELNQEFLDQLDIKKKKM